MSSKVERSDPQLWERVKRDLTRSDKGGKPEQWSARRATRSVAISSAASSIRASRCGSPRRRRGTARVGSAPSGASPPRLSYTQSSDDAACAVAPK